MSVKIPKLLKFLYPRRVWNGPKGRKTIYLTFDDGPIPQITPWVLDQLENYKAKATFFCIGENILKNPEIFRRIVSSGHAVGNHTHNHLNGWKTSKSEYLNNTTKAQNTFEEELNRNNHPYKEIPHLFRPPYGKIRGNQARTLSQMGYQIVMWDVLSRDYDPAVSPVQCYHNVAKNIDDGNIVVFHDSLKASKNLQYALPRVLDVFSQRGFRFDKL